MKKVIITGATGIVGIALLKYCIEQNTKVLAVVRPDSQNLNRLPALSKNLEIIECDLVGIDQLPLMAEGRFDVFYHLGWTAKGKSRRDDPVLQSQDIGITLQAVLAAKKLGCEAFIGVGSQTEYGRLDRAISPAVSVNPETAYGVAKFAAGKLSSLLCRDLGIRHVWARVFSTFGPFDNHDSMILYAIDKLLKAEKPSFTKCEQLWDYLHCQDTARALYLLGMHGKNQTIYNVGSGKARPLYEYIQILRDTIDKSLPIGIGEKEYAQNQIMHLCADISNLTNDTGFEAEISFEEGIRCTIDWYKEWKLNEDTDKHEI